ncbi:inorganic phosphate transporter [Rugosimonospora africana]|uniref:Phosphate transporter n=1 Tax=Rugosimonospora africana TaxID=556532 RepID=A0A8J3QPP9_9ACTN|nr:inorganic phosphate transporter [Rugosimonospora africana]GIH14221.1 phosphate transporter [Rugosimonospora africana]
MSLLVVLVIITALAFDFTNGFHDTANAMATSIATGALRPKVAVGLSAVLNIVGAFLSVQVAKTISGGIVDDAKITPAIVFGGLIGAILWNLMTWLAGLPSSSSHALFGGLIGATWIAAGHGAVHFDKVMEKVIIPALASPLIAGFVALIATFAVYTLTRRARKDTVTRGFRSGQAISASMVSLAHGTNDAQKTMGVITLTLIAAKELPSGSGPPFWVIVTAGLAIAAGTYLGGWRIIRTVGHRITQVESPQGFAAETAAAAVILASSHQGYALSTTHVCSGSVIGSGVGKRLAEVRWGVAGQMVIAWVLTLPAAAVVGALAGRLASAGTWGIVLVAALGVAAAAAIYLRSRPNAIHAGNINEVDSSGATQTRPTPTPAGTPA